MQVIGVGRVGSSLAKRAERLGASIRLLGREGALERSGPILVATRNDDLPAVLQRVPVEQHPDLVFLQNGWLRDWLDGAGVGGNTRGLLYFAATAREGAIEPGTTSWFTGPHAVRVAAWFRSLDLQAEALDAADYAQVELEKLAWLCCFGPLCAVHGCTVSEVIDQHSTQLRTLVGELVAFGRIVGVQVSVDELLAGLVRYSLSIPGYRASVKEWRWRNGAVLERMEQAGVPSPLQRTLTVRYAPADGGPNA